MLLVYISPLLFWDLQLLGRIFNCGDELLPDTKAAAAAAVAAIRDRLCMQNRTKCIIFWVKAGLDRTWR